MRATAARKSGRGAANLCERHDYLGGFGIFHTAAAQTRIAKWDSAA